MPARRHMGRRNGFAPGGRGVALIGGSIWLAPPSKARGTRSRGTKQSNAGYLAEARRILDVLRKGPATLDLIAREVGMPRDVVKRRLHGALRDRGCIAGDGFGWWVWTGVELPTEEQERAERSRMLSEGRRRQSQIRREGEYIPSIVQILVAADLERWGDQPAPEKPRPKRLADAKTPAEACAMMLAEWRQLRRAAS